MQLLANQAFQSSFVPPRPIQPNKVGESASGATIPELLITAQQDRSVASPNPIPTTGTDYALPQLVPLSPLQPTMTACRLAHYAQNWARITQDPCVLHSIKGCNCARYPLICDKTIPMANWC